jgi:hypothetical protein
MNAGIPIQCASCTAQNEPVKHTRTASGDTRDYAAVSECGATRVKLLPCMALRSLVLLDGMGWDGSDQFYSACVSFLHNQTTFIHTLNRVSLYTSSQYSIKEAISVNR